MKQPSQYDIKSVNMYKDLFNVSFQRFAESH
ncbi:MAG: hypothetical protein ACI97N_002675 [Cognaticolwellia sp.]|jgi:hypothetical protein